MDKAPTIEQYLALKKERDELLEMYLNVPQIKERIAKMDEEVLAEIPSREELMRDLVTDMSLSQFIDELERHL